MRNYPAIWLEAMRSYGSVRIASDPYEIRKEHLPNIPLLLYPFGNQYLVKLM
jgi:hypothetical protein